MWLRLRFPYETMTEKIDLWLDGGAEFAFQPYGFLRSWKQFAQSIKFIDLDSSLDFLHSSNWPIEVCFLVLLQSHMHKCMKWSLVSEIHTLNE